MLFLLAAIHVPHSTSVCVCVKQEQRCSLSRREKVTDVSTPSRSPSLSTDSCEVAIKALKAGMLSVQTVWSPSFSLSLSLLTSPLLRTPPSLPYSFNFLQSPSLPNTSPKTHTAFKVHTHTHTGTCREQRTNACIPTYIHIIPSTHYYTENHIISIPLCIYVCVHVYMCLYVCVCVCARYVHV